jgi:2-methylisocitrate lyase-like PEP mutase family enzyme
LTAFRASIVTMRNTLNEIKKNGYVDHTSPSMMSVHDLHNLMGLEKIQEQEGRFLREEQAAE